MSAGVYCLINKINNKRYIGCSYDMKRRIHDHFIRPRILGDSPLYKEIRELGKENFESEILFELGKIDKDWRETLWIHEKYFIHKFDTTNPEKGYNKSVGGKGPKGTKHSEEARNRMRESHIGKSSGFLGKTHSEESKAKIGSKLKGKPLKEETKKKMSEARKLWWATKGKSS